jgi:[ribosomal protein S5]-alanine N-acetyltransferase
MQVTIRPWTMHDVPHLVRMMNNKNSWDNVRDYIPFPYTEKDAAAWLQQVVPESPATKFCIEADGIPCGNMGALLQTDVYRKTIEVGYVMDEAYWGRGIATAAMAQLLDYIERTFDVVRIYASVFEHNRASMRVLEKNGFHLESVKKKGAVKNNMVIDDYVWVKLIG